MTQHRRIYLDMDGTLFRFYDTEHEYIERIWEPGFYRNLKPFQNLVDAVRMFMKKQIIFRVRSPTD